MSIDRAALVAGSIRLASGVQFLVDPLRANRLWGDRSEPSPTARLLLRSMGYRDALIGALLLTSGLRGKNSRGWFLASAGADASDLVGGLSVHDELTRSQQLIGLGGAILGVGVGLWGAVAPDGAAGRSAGARLAVGWRRFSSDQWLRFALGQLVRRDRAEGARLAHEPGRRIGQRIRAFEPETTRCERTEQ